MLSPADGLAALARVVASGSQAATATLAERQAAWRMLGELDSSPARALIAEGVDRWASGRLAEAEALELLEAAAVHDDAVGRRARQLLAPPLEGEATGLVEARRWALAGGDVEAGERVFQTVGDCQRCHGGGGGHGGGAGPTLDGVHRRGAEHVLTSLVAPNADLADGFASITVAREDGSRISGVVLAEDAVRDVLVLDAGGARPIEIPIDEIVERTDPISSMPPMGLLLEARALRDVVAYVMALEAS